MFQTETGCVKISPKKPPPTSRRKTGCLTDHSRASQPSPISLDSNQANDLTNWHNTLWGVGQRN